MKTAIDWLFEKLFQEREDGQLLYQLEEDIVGLFEQAKEMEKQQIEDAFYQTEIDEFGDELSFEQYYNETYGK